ncbi:hypothetical protein CHUAL_014020 [Chamberlinius hualienensis]
MISQKFAAHLSSLYGRPKKTLYNTFASSLFDSGNTIDEISSYLNASTSTTQLYLVDSAMCDEPVDCGRLCKTMGVSQKMVERVAKLVRSNHFVTLSKLVSLTRYTSNQVRVCIAALYRGCT